MRKILYILAFAVFFGYGISYSHAQLSIKDIATKAKDEKKDSADSTKKEDEKDIFAKLAKEATKRTGLFNTYTTKDGKLYFEIDTLKMNKLYGFANRVAAVSRTDDYVAGQLVDRPFVMKISCDSNRVYFHKVQTTNIVRENDPIVPAFKRNFLSPIFESFKIEGKKNGSVVIDVTNLFTTNNENITPMKADNPFQKLFGGGNQLKGSFKKDNSFLMWAKSFPRNIEIRSTLSYRLSTQQAPYTLEMQRSIYLLPDEPMMPRKADERVGFFSTGKNYYSSDKDRVTDFNYINRWRLEIDPKDSIRYQKGELVEPKQKIVYYVDTAFPEKWRKVVRAGIEDWNTAFKYAGFKNAVEARDYPADSTFDPDDIRYNCVRYVASPVANASGPSYVDPRTGEILMASVIWYHNVVSLVHDWRFAQTSAVDPRVRKLVFDDDVMGESLRYVAAHEIGHTLGLMHNMGASYAFTIDSLRSPSFTQKYGTTPSIMDYARNNYVAQPGDFEKGVRLVPPLIGVYDNYAIHWGYTIIPNITTPDDETDTLNQWIARHEGDPKYKYGAQQIFGNVDPTDLTEDLGQDHVRAGNLGISNLKISLANLTKWIKEDGANYSSIEPLYTSIVSQYTRYLSHVMPMIGGIEYEIRRQGEEGKANNYVKKADQRKAMKWLINQGRTFPKWLMPTELTNRLEYDKSRLSRLQKAIIASLVNSQALYRIDEGSKEGRDYYDIDEYAEDLFNELVYSHGYKMSKEDILMQQFLIDRLMSLTSLETSKKSKKRSIADASEYLDEFMESYHCSHDKSFENNFRVRINFGQPALDESRLAPWALSLLYKMKKYYSTLSTYDNATTQFAEYQKLKIDKFLAQ